MKIRCKCNQIIKRYPIMPNDAVRDRFDTTLRLVLKLDACCSFLLSALVCCVYGFMQG